MCFLKTATPGICRPIRILRPGRLYLFVEFREQAVMVLGYPVAVALLRDAMVCVEDE